MAKKTAAEKLLQIAINSYIDSWNSTAIVSCLLHLKPEKCRWLFSLFFFFKLAHSHCKHLKDPMLWISAQCQRGIGFLLLRGLGG